MSPAAAKRLRLLASAVSVLVVVGLIAGGWFCFRMRASLPQLDGRAVVAGLGAPVTIERDALGVPTIKAQSRADVARGLGWLHAQDRFFQMDLLRRNSAGELSELFGPRALNHDKAVRIHGFRTLAKQVLPTLPADQRAVLQAYVEGVNAGLDALGAAPFEYIVLRATPAPWTPEDTLLVGYTMALDLQDETGAYEKTLMTLRDVLEPESVAFFAPWVGPDDAALDGTTAPLPPIPGPDIINLRTRRTVQNDPLGPTRAAIVTRIENSNTRDTFPSTAGDPEFAAGSNAFALSGAHTANGAGLLANDMHLALRVPNVWYRASFELGGRRVTGATLPGTPPMVVGSNGRVAWGFTASYADTGDLVAVDHAPGLINWYVTPERTDGVKIERRQETIRVKGEADVPMEYPWTIWGPIVGKDHREHPLVLRWTAHFPSAFSTNLLAMEDATDVASAVAVANRAGITTVNCVIADSTGKIAWTIAGALPKRVGFDGRLPTSWVYGDRKWAGDGLLPPAEIPAVIDPADGRIWSANQRAVGGAALATIGDGGFARPARAAQIRDGLAKIERATPKDLLALQLDDRALFLAPWHKLLLDTLTPAVTGEKSARAKLRTLAEKWEGRASIDAVSYPIVRAFRIAVRERVLAPIFAPCIEANAEFDWRRLPSEPALWALLREKPLHLLDPQFASWDALLAAAVDDTIAALDDAGGLSTSNTWGRQNTARINHPFGQLLPAMFTGWLNLPADPLSGDNDMPRVARPNDGASERMVVSPGHEAEGIFHMPGGQSGHPLSPFYRAGHEAWVRGEPTPFLPGKAEHTLELAPR